MYLIGGFPLPVSALFWVKMGHNSSYQGLKWLQVMITDDEKSLFRFCEVLYCEFSLYFDEVDGLSCITFHHEELRPNISLQLFYIKDLIFSSFFPTLYVSFFSLSFFSFNIHDSFPSGNVVNDKKTP